MASPYHLADATLPWGFMKNSRWRQNTVNDMGPERRRGRPASLGHFAKPFSASVQTNVLSQRLTRLLTRLQQFLRRGEIPVETGAPDLGRKLANRVQGSLKTVSVLGSEPDFRRALTFVHNHSRSEPVLLISGIESGILSRESSFRSATNFYAQRMRAVIQETSDNT